MSFYGNIKRVNSSPFVFDRYFPSRKDMESKIGTSDGVYVGRYVLIRYDCAYKTGSTDSIDDLDFFTRYIEELDTNGNKKEDPRFTQNCNDDLERYHDTFNGTVWQKIYTTVNSDGSPSEKYIMVAELNADAPKLGLSIISPKKLIDNEKEEWNKPEVMKNGFSEEVYKISMPDILHLNVGDMSGDYYGRDLLNPSRKGTLPDSISSQEAFLPEYNYVDWKNITYERDENGIPKKNTEGKLISKTSQPGDNIDEKKLDMKLYGFGQAISNMYDALYGVPGVDGKRPFFTTDNVVMPENKGLIGILTSIGAEAKGDPTQDTYGRSMNSGMYYYFISKWKSADEDPQTFIENIPYVVGASEDNGGSSAYSQLYINFDATSTIEGELPSYVTKWS